MAMSERTGYVQIYTGDGKGKTTAAFGLAMRAAGRGLSVLVTQFMKADPSCGEVVSAERLGIRVEQVGLDHWVRLGEATPDDRRAAAAGFARARDLVGGGRYDVVVLDELITAVFFELVTAADVAPCLPASRPTSSLWPPAGGRRPRSSRPPIWSPRCGRSSTTTTPASEPAKVSSTERRASAGPRSDGVG